MFPVIFSGLLLLTNCSGRADSKTVTTFKLPGEDVYRNNCAGCHGGELQGSAASSLLKENLFHGNDTNAIGNIIRHGIPMSEMIKWDTILSEKEITDVTNYIIAVRNNPAIAKKEMTDFTIRTRDYDLNVQRLVTKGIDGAWGMEFTDKDHILITGKEGKLYRIANNKLDTNQISGLPKVYGYDLVGGLMDLALDPDYKNNGWIYLAYSHNDQNTTDKNAPGMTKLARGKLKGNTWTETQTLLQVPDSVYVTGGTRWGSRLFFDKDGYLFFTVGDMGQSVQKGDAPQRFTRAEGKIFRLHADGTIPADNPLFGNKNSLQAIYAWGTRNVQGLAQHPVSGKIYFTDHGPQGGDELNLLKKGGNYGWPLVTFGINYDGTPVTKDTVKQGMEQPLLYWTPSIAVCAAEYCTSPLFPKWKNKLFVTALRFEEIRKIEMEDDKVLDQEIFLKGYGRVRDLKFGPDGAMYVLTNGPDALLKITPK